MCQTRGHALIAAFCLMVASTLIPVNQALSPSSQCRNDAGELVDHWIIMKPNETFAYIISDNSTTEFSLSLFQLNSTASALGQTMSQLYSANSSMQYIIYNDEPAPLSLVARDDRQYRSFDSAESEPGHTKGVLAFDNELQLGFWLTHSIPLWPNPPQSQFYAGIDIGEERFAQSMFCVSLQMNEIELLAGLLVLNAPDIYAKNVSDSTLLAFPNIASLYAKNFSKAPECTNTTIHGMNVFAKTGRWGKDLWSSCIAPAYESGILAETWLRGDVCGPACPPQYNYTTLDVRSLNFGFPNFSWNEGDDHGKWGLVTNSPVVCFGDINRMTSQYSRGGGAICLENYSVWLQFSTAITSTDQCP